MVEPSPPDPEFLQQVLAFHIRQANVYKILLERGVELNISKPVVGEEITQCSQNDGFLSAPEKQPKHDELSLADCQVILSQRDSDDGTSEEIKPRKRELKAKKKITKKQVEPKRGRKREQWDRFVKTSNDKINLYREKLKTAIEDGVPAKTRSKWRNIITAQVSRLKHKTLIRLLHMLIDGKDSRLKTLLNIVSKNLMEDGSEHLLASILKIA